MQVAGLLQLQRGLARDGERRTAADGRPGCRCRRVRRAARSSRARRRRRAAAAGASTRRASAARRSMPPTRRDQRGEAATKVLVAATLSSGPAPIGSTMSQAARERAVGVVDQRDGERAGRAWPSRACSIRSSLPPDWEMARNSWPSSRRRPPVHGGDVGRRRGHRDAEIALDQVLAEGRGVGRAAARAGHHHLGRSRLQPADQLGDRRGERAGLAARRRSAASRISAAIRACGTPMVRLLERPRRQPSPRQPAPAAARRRARRRRGSPAATRSRRRARAGSARPARRAWRAAARRR